MALTGSTIASTYLKLLRINTDTMGADATASYIQDSADTDSALSISTTRVGIGNAAPASVLHLTGTMQVGVDGTGHDVIFYGDTASGNMTWDESEDDLVLNDARLFVDQDVATVDSIVVDTEATSAHGLTIAGDALTTGSAGVFSTSSTALASTATGGLVEISSTGDTDTNVNNLVFIKNDHADSSVTTCLFIDQDANYRGITIDSEATSKPNLIFLAPAMTTGQIIEVNDANSLTSGGIAYFFSNSPDNTSSRNLVSIVNENDAADKAVCLMIQQDGDDASIEFTGAGGGGIKFSMGTDPDTAGTATGNTLDDYEEGTWDGVVTDGTNPMTMHGSYDTGYYTKVGNLVTVTGRFVTTSLGSASGNIRITGLPFTVANAQAAYNSGAAGYGTGLDLAAAGYIVGYRSDINQTYMELQVWDATTGTSSMTASEWTADGGIMMGLSYRAA
jgi:hypothetical protein